MVRGGAWWRVTCGLRGVRGVRGVRGARDAGRSLRVNTHDGPPFRTSEIH